MKLPLLTVMITTYNASAFIRETIDSVLCQTFDDFELLVGDDASSDDTCDIIESYSDPRIRLIRCSHDFIETENRLLYEAKGKYIARLDHDDRMLPNRLRIQYEYMESHPEIDALGGAAVCFGGSREKFKVWAGHKFTVSDFLKSNYIVNPSSMLRRDSIVRNSLRYKRRYLYADDYGFWVDMLKAGLHIENISNTLIEYRVSPGQTSTIYAGIQRESVEKVVNDLYEWLSNKYCPKEAIPNINDSGKKITVIIPFLNEGEEIVKTVESVRKTAGDSVDIITINDLSTDGYDYFKELDRYDVYYVFNKKRLGVAASRDFGIFLSTTPYFLLLDGHMKFYSKGWEAQLSALLAEDDRRILCCQGHALQKENGVVSDYEGVVDNYGAYFPFVKGKSLLEIRWNSHEYSQNKETDPIPVVLGAGYVASKRYWKYLRGLEGLQSYGSDEQYISLKVWLEGGKCVLVKNIVIGHIYRKASPFKRFNEKEVFNQLLISYMLFPQSWHAMNLAFFYLAERGGYNYAKKTLEDGKERWDRLRTYYKKICHSNFRHFVSVQQKLLRSKGEPLLQYSTLLPKIAGFLASHIPEDYGIFEGKMGLLLWFCHYAKISASEEAEKIASELWGLIAAGIERQALPTNFRHGLAGIGWGVIYLAENNLIDDDISIILDKIDRQLSYIDLGRIEDADIDYGLGGYMAYYTARCRHSNGGKADGLLLKDAAYRILEKSSSFVSVAYAFRMLLINRYGLDNDDVPLNIREWLDGSNAIPQNMKYWTSSLADMTMNTSLSVMKYMEH